ncbi:MAG TPA: di-heme oxidoredictase family protein, partial [Bryobacteraceae bacterium]|nr:di-heme oxidoredictase family protein [Bryobacteraceae bacterium]
MNARTLILAALIAAVQVHAQIPRTWSQSAVDSLELPLASAEHSPVHLDEAAYYRIPERVLYKTYPVYDRAHEPAGYSAWLKSRDPEVSFVASKIKSHEDWIAAGELVFNAPTSFGPIFFTAENLRDPAFYKTAGMPVAKDGTIPFARWVVRTKGTVELGSMGCNTCHTRVLSDGTVVAGAQGNNSNDRQGALLLRGSVKVLGEEKTLERVRGFARQFEMPWLPNDINRLTRTMPLAGLIAAGEGVPPGVTARANTSMLLPPQIPDLIGVQERRYLDHTGLIRQRDIGDLMRYSSLAQDLFTQDRYGSATVSEARPPSVRYSDEQLYALALYLYSLRPPANPNLFNAAAARGKKVFESEKCGNCHTAPLYSSNKLVAVDGFQPPTGGEFAADVISERVGTDP